MGIREEKLKKEKTNKGTEQQRNKQAKKEREKNKESEEQWQGIKEGNQQQVTR